MPEPSLPARPARRSYLADLTPEERSDQARLAANTRWARVADARAETRAAREARFARHYAEADRLGVVDPAVRERMARNALEAEMARVRQAKARKARARGGEAA